MVSQNIAQPIDRVVQAVIELDEGIGSPERLPKLLARDHFVGPLDQDLQDAKGLLRQLQPHPLLPQLASIEVGLEDGRNAPEVDEG